MAGRIRDEDVVLVRERAPIADVVGESVQLRPAGGGRLKGLCPFHDEKSPSFNVNPALGYYMCFGCGESGDVISFVRGTEHLSFVETVERLAARYGVPLHYEQGSAAAGRQTSQRTRLVAAHKEAAAFYAEQLGTPEAVTGRQFLAERGFDQAAAATYGVGYAPQGWDALTKHLRGKGYSNEELILGGLVSEGRRGPIDRFRGRLVWPIRDIAGDVVGFGARKLYEDDNGPKYLNTSETPIYKKSSVLYGLDLAKKEIAKRRQAVVVEGYTDVMACHLAGIPTAVATCGTAFGNEHIGLIRRLLLDQDEMRGEVVFTFDGDAAGQKAALKAFGEEQRFVSQTFIAVSPGGMDPCELRLAHGDLAVRDMVAARVPLVEFALRKTVDQYDASTTEGQLAALDAAAPLIAKIRDQGLRQRYAVNLDRWLGLMDEKFVLARVAQSMGSTPQQRRASPAARPVDSAATAVERELVKLAVQLPVLVAPQYDALGEDCFTLPDLQAVHAVIAKAGGTSQAAGGEPWVGALLEACEDDQTRSLVTRLAVEAPLSDFEPDDRYAGAVLARVQELAATRATAAVKATLQRVNPEEEPERYYRLFAELVSLEQTVRALRERGIGAT
ncbi:MAG: primase [Frankiales bacterium]|nr:primase [Frankiales bacterium]